MFRPPSVPIHQFCGSRLPIGEVCSFAAAALLFGHSAQASPPSVHASGTSVAAAPRILSQAVELPVPERVPPPPPRREGVGLIISGWSLFATSYTIGALQSANAAAWGASPAGLHLLPGVGPILGGAMLRRSMGQEFAALSIVVGAGQLAGLTMAIVGHRRRSAGQARRARIAVSPTHDGLRASLSARF